MKIFGLTGGIATGKSTVRQMFEDHKVPTIDADKVGHEIINPGTSAYKTIVKTFGKEILQSDTPQSPIDRAKLGALIFNDDAKRKQLNKITHPAIIKRIIYLIFLNFIRGEPAIIIDSPLLYEVGLDKICSKVILVYVPQELQLERLLARNPELGEQAEKRIAAQISIEEKKKRTKCVIENSGTLQQTKLLVDDMYNQIFPRSRVFTIRNILLTALATITICFFILSKVI